MFDIITQLTIKVHYLCRKTVYICINLKCIVNMIILWMVTMETTVGTYFIVNYNHVDDCQETIVL